MSVPPGWCDPSDPNNPANQNPDPSPFTEPPATQIIPGLFSNLCSKGWRPILITGLLRDLLVRHFATPQNITEDDLRKYIWQENPPTGILIESIHRWRGDLVEKRPAIILKRNAYQNMRFGIADRVRTTEDGHVEFTTGWVGSHTVFCIHGTGASVELLATEVVSYLNRFHPVIVEYLGLLRWNVTEVGAIAEIEEAKESFVVPITIGWAYTDNWRIELESMKLRRVTLSTLLKC